LEESIYQNPQVPSQISVKTGTELVLLPQNPTFLTKCQMFEPLYVPDEEILENSLRREIEKFCFADTLLNRIVYDSVDTSPFTKDLEPRSLGLDVLPYYLPLSKDDTTLIFESRFESGNLRRAIQIYDYEYNLILKPDY
jgi:cytosolic carboxypeptidase protein 2/3